MAGPTPDAGRAKRGRAIDDKAIDDKATTKQDRFGEALGPTATSSTSTTAKPTDWEPVYTAGEAHDHRPTGKWKEIQAEPVTAGFLEFQVCVRYGPEGVVAEAKNHLSDRPLALRHLEHYLTGRGKDFVEDSNLERMLRSDAGVRRALALGIFRREQRPIQPLRGWIELRQADYEREDFQFAFGGIDRLDFEADFSADTLRVWFQDRYEWHPVYAGIYDRQPGDSIRDTNCVHAAMVEMKSNGAADFWMKGKAVVPLRLFEAARKPAQRQPRRTY